MKLSMYVSVFQHIRHISNLSFAIVGNCAYNRQFVSYLLPIDWARFLAPWISSSIGSTRIHAKICCSHVGLSLCSDDLSLLKLEGRDVNSLIQGLGSASSSHNLQGSAFGYSFSAYELLTIVQNLIIYPDNLQAFAEANLVPSLVALIVNGSPSVKKMVYYVFWCLLDSPDFRDIVKSSVLPLADVFSEQDDDVFTTLFAELILVEIHNILGYRKFLVDGEFHGNMHFLFFVQKML